MLSEVSDLKLYNMFDTARYIMYCIRFDIQLGGVLRDAIIRAFLLF